MYVSISEWFGIHRSVTSRNYILITNKQFYIRQSNQPTENFTIVISLIHTSIVMNWDEPKPYFQSNPIIILKQKQLLTPKKKRRTRNKSSLTRPVNFICQKITEINSRNWRLGSPCQSKFRVTEWHHYSQVIGFNRVVSLYCLVSNFTFRGSIVRRYNDRRMTYGFGAYGVWRRAPSATSKRWPPLMLPPRRL